MSVVGKSTCSGLKPWMYISYHGGNVASVSNREFILRNMVEFLVIFDTKHMIFLRIEQLLHNFEDQKIANFFNIEQINFRMTLVILVLDVKVHVYI